MTCCWIAARFFWVEHSAWLWALLGMSLLAMTFLRAKYFAPTERSVQWPDVIDLGLFAAGGTQIALASGMPSIVAVLMGMVDVHPNQITQWKTQLLENASGVFPALPRSSQPDRI